MFISIPTVAVHGLEGVRIDVESDVGAGFGKFFIVGLPDAAINESRHRVKTAINNSGFNCTTRNITVSLAPADAKKSGPSFDLPIAVGLIGQRERLNMDVVDTSIFIGELALDGMLRPVTSVLPSVLFARDHGFKRVFVPKDNASEAALVPEIDVIAVEDLMTVIQMIQ